MSWHIELTRGAARQLAKQDPSTQRVIVAWLSKNVEGCEAPRAHGKALTVDLAGAWRYRIGDYRFICETGDDRLVVLALSIAHRSVSHEDARRRGGWRK